MPTNKQRRDTARRHLERQLQRRAEREQRRRRVTLIASIAGTLVLIAVIVIAFVAFSGDDSKPKVAAGNGGGTSSASPTTSSTLPTSPSPTPTPSVSYPPASGPSVSYNGVTVKGATDLKGIPGVTSKGSGDPSKLEVKDLVVGKGKAATPTSTVNVQYYGVLYKNGQYFDSSWKRGMPTSFPLTGVVPGFTQGIGGNAAGHIAPMKVGGRRIIIVPSAMGYGKQAQPGIPANSPLVFIVDLKSVS